MRLLLDTHAFLWAIADPDKLSAKVKRLLLDQHNEIWLSAASLWEIALKAAAGKLELPQERDYFEKHLAYLGARVLPITARHVLEIFQLPHHHRDPFDRLMVAQSLCEDLVLVTKDKSIRRYGIRALW